MNYQVPDTLVKHTYVRYIAECPVCKDRTENREGHVKERFCMKCSVWVPYVETVIEQSTGIKQ